MSAFNALEKRILDLSLARASDNPEAAIVVGLFRPGSTSTTTSVARTTVRVATAAAATVVPVVSVVNLAVNDIVRINDGLGTMEERTITAVVATGGSESITVNAALTNAHALGESVVERVTTVTNLPMPEDHSGAYGQAGEPAASAPTVQGGYRRARATFATQAAGSNNGTTTNTSVITITGLTPGTYTHFGVFGSTGGGAT